MNAKYFSEFYLDYMFNNIYFYNSDNTSFKY